MALDDQDKKWIVEQLQAVEGRLETTLEAKFEAKLEAKLDEKLEQKLAAFEQKFDAKLALKLHDTETKLLTALFGYHEQWEIVAREPGLFPAPPPRVSDDHSVQA